jgi:High potential iron-sulfur protein
MSQSNRRVFMLRAAVGCGALVAGQAMAQAPAAKPAAGAGPAMLSETDPTAVALGYKADGTKADTKKYPKYAASQNCLSCQLYQGKAGDVAGACGIFAGKQVAAKGWCSSWVKKA